MLRQSRQLDQANVVRHMQVTTLALMSRSWGHEQVYHSPLWCIGLTTKRVTRGYCMWPLPWPAVASAPGMLLQG